MAKRAPRKSALTVRKIGPQTGHVVRRLIKRASPDDPLFDAGYLIFSPQPPRAERLPNGRHTPTLLVEDDPLTNWFRSLPQQELERLFFGKRSRAKRKKVPA